MTPTEPTHYLLIKADAPEIPDYGPRLAILPFGNEDVERLADRARQTLALQKGDGGPNLCQWLDLSIVWFNPFDAGQLDDDAFAWMEYLFRVLDNDVLVLTADELAMDYPDIHGPMERGAGYPTYHTVFTTSGDKVQWSAEIMGTASRLLSAEADVGTLLQLFREKTSAVSREAIRHSPCP